MIKGFLFTITFCVVSFSSLAQRITTIAGTNGDGLNAKNAQLSDAESVAVDKNGNIYVADGLTNSVRRIDNATGIITTVAGNGSAGYSGDNGPAIDAKLNLPVDIVIDGSDNIYIADQRNERIRKVDVSTGIITTFAGNGNFGNDGDGNLAINASIGNPKSIAFDKTGNVYVSQEYGGVVRKIDRLSNIITTIAGNGTTGFSGDNGLAVNAELSFVSGLAVDDFNNVYVADTYSSRIRKIDALTGIITTVAGGGSGGDNVLAVNSALIAPLGIAFDKDGNLYIDDEGHNRIRVVNSASGIISTAAGVPVGFGFGGDGGIATAALMFFPKDITVSKVNGDLLIADHDRIRKVANNIITTIAGNGGFGGDGGASTDATLNGPSGLALDSIGNIYVADAENKRIRKINSADGIISTVAGGGTSGHDGDPLNADINNPTGVAVDNLGNVYFVDHYCSVRKVDLASGLITTIAGNLGQGFGGDNGQSTSSLLSSPISLAIDSKGNIYVADWGNNRIRKINSATGIITTVAGNGIGGYAGDNGNATDAWVGSPTGICVDKNDNFYIAHNFSIRKVNVSTGIISKIAGTGVEGFFGDNGLAINAKFGSIHNITFDSEGNLFVTDSDNNRIRRIDALTGIITTVAGTGTSGFSGDGGLAVNAQLHGSMGIAVDKRGNLFIGDTENNRIRKVLNPFQKITFDTIPDKPVTDAPFVLKAHSNSGLPVTFSSTSANVIIADSLVTLVGPGTATILASQVGDENYHAASVSQSFCVIPGSPLISVAAGPDVPKTLASNSPWHNRWFNDGILIPGDTTAVFTTSLTGIYTCKILVGGCYSPDSNPISLIITQIEDTFDNSKLIIYPNPSHDITKLNLKYFDKDFLVDVSVSDLLGHLIIGQKTSIEESSIDVGRLSPGCYIIQASQNGLTQATKFLKK